MARHPSLRDRFGRLPALAGDLPALDPSTVPADPVTLFLDWFGDAVATGVAEPHVVTVATADAEGRPSSRAVVLSDVVDGAWRFATDRRSRKARDLRVNPHAALSFYWQPQGRQIRVEGPAEELSPQECAADFLSRSPAARAAALATRPGETLGAPDEAHAAVEAARRVLESEPDRVPADWVVYAVRPTRVEFWQGDVARGHVRVAYTAAVADGTWSHRTLWP